MTDVLEHPATALAVSASADPARADPGIVLLDNEKFTVWYEKLKAEAPTDVSVGTNKGRDLLRAYAAKVRSEKAAIDKARLRLTAGWRDMTAQANAAGKTIAEQLEALAVEVRGPLTAWEEAEKAREAACQAVIDGFRIAKFINEEDTADTVRARGMEVYQTAIDPDQFGDMADEAEAAKADAVATLKRALDRMTREEAERAELEKLRAEAAERERAEAEQMAAQQAEQARIDAERIMEDARVAAEQAEAERVRIAAERAAQDARDAAELAARAEQAERDRAAQAEIDAANERADRIQRDRQDEADRLAAEQAKRDAEASRIAAEQAEREANVAHRTKIKRAAKQALMTCGATEEVAQKIVIAIIAGEIPAISLAF